MFHRYMVIHYSNAIINSADFLYRQYCVVTTTECSCFVNANCLIFFLQDTEITVIKPQYTIFTHEDLL